MFFDGVHHWFTSRVYNLLRMACSAQSCDVKNQFVSGMPFFSTYTNIGIPFFYLRNVNKCSLMVYIMGVLHGCTSQVYITSEHHGRTSVLLTEITLLLYGFILMFFILQ